MQSYEVIQKILSIGPSYEVRRTGFDDVLATVNGTVLSFAPRLTMVQGNDGSQMAKLTGNFLRTSFVMTATNGSELAVLRFPLIALKAKFTLSMKDETYTAKGGVLAMKFSCVDKAGNLVFTVHMQIGLGDRFTVDVAEDFPKEVAFLAAVAIDQKFFENN